MRFKDILFYVVLSLGTVSITHQRLTEIENNMQTIISKDGTLISFWKSGSGPALLLVHGATADHTTTWRFVIRELEQHFTVYAMDRRGRGGSGDNADYNLQREAEDIATIIDSFNEPVNLLGHSYGALCAFEASLLTDNLNRMILYEGVPLNGTELYPPGIVDRLDEMLDSGNLEGILISLFKDIVQMSPEELEMMRSQQHAWSVRLNNTPTLPREIRAETTYRFEPGRFQSMETPTMFLVGADSPPRELKNASIIANALPFAKVVALPGQGHGAMYAAPELFVSEVSEFLLGVSLENLPE
jgi:pimeloyl-ACP methyl ester carboxylesterase